MSAVLILSHVDAAYIAGIVDGEGTITLSRLHRNEQRRIVVSVSNNERALLEYIQQTVGAGRISNKRTYGENHAPAFHYQINSRQALDLLSQIAPYLRTYKAVRARLALETSAGHSTERQVHAAATGRAAVVRAGIPLRYGSQPRPFSVCN